jgi:hypothetical protein
MSQGLRSVLWSLGARLFRRSLASLLVDPGHPVLVTEEGLIQEALDSLPRLISELHASRHGEILSFVLRSIRSSALFGPIEDPEDPVLLNAVQAAEVDASAVLSDLVPPPFSSRTP